MSLASMFRGRRAEIRGRCRKCAAYEQAFGPVSQSAPLSAAFDKWEREQAATEKEPYYPKHARSP